MWWDRNGNSPFLIVLYTILLLGTTEAYPKPQLCWYAVTGGIS